MVSPRAGTILRDLGAAKAVAPGGAGEMVVEEGETEGATAVGTWEDRVVVKVVAKVVAVTVVVV